MAMAASGRFDGSETTSASPATRTMRGTHPERIYFGVLTTAPVRCCGCWPVPTIEQDVVWQYGPLVDAGWAEVDELTRARAVRRRC
jgi:hypothetical protein